ncbi:MAG: lipocalin-like domain-containing protein [Paramuribaculum sp.]|nr:lipocalin-like domain-containing protein [Paramuribaculum sp.]
MRVSLYILFILAAMVLAAAGCTRNNGAIGAWFGTWQVTSISVNGTPVADYDGNISVMFQNNILKSIELLEHHEYNEYFATWSVEGATLSIDAVKGGVAPGLMMPAGSVVHVELLRRPGKVMQWRYVDESGTVYDYDLKKLY